MTVHLSYLWFSGLVLSFFSERLPELLIEVNTTGMQQGIGNMQHHLGSVYTAQQLAIACLRIPAIQKRIS